MSARAAGAASVDVRLAESRAWADAELAHVLDQERGTPPRLAEAIRYALLGPGKRLRPALVRVVNAHLGGADAAAAAPACAIECVHAYSLVHDDLPCMDDDDLRRGRPTCHKVYGEALAVLAGDALLTLAFELLARSGPRAAEHAAVLAAAAGSAGMVGGQALDLEPGAGPATRASVEDVHARKTAALFSAATEMGAIAAGASSADRSTARAYGLALGRCFQAVDDVLDVTGDAASLGKTPGKDERHSKPTLVAVLSVDGARAEAARLAGLAREAARSLRCGPGDLPYDLVDRLLARTA